MKFSRIAPSDVKFLTDKATGLKLSYRDLTAVASLAIQAASLIKFGEEAYLKHKDSGNLFYYYDVEGKGKGYVAYKIGDTVSVNDILVADFKKKKQTNECIEALIETLYNICKSLNLTLEVETDSKDFYVFVRDVNQSYKEQKLEDKYWWKIE